MNPASPSQVFPEVIKYALANKPKNRPEAERLYKLVLNEFSNWCIENLSPADRIGFKYSMGMYFDMPPLSVGLEPITYPENPTTGHKN